LLHVWRATSNLAAPLAGSLAAAAAAAADLTLCRCRLQSLFSGYQRYSLARSKKKRKELLGKMKQRSEKLKATMQAALAAKKAAGTAEDAAAASDAAPADESVTADSVAEGVSKADASGDAVDNSSSGKQEDVDFLTLVLQAAEQQQEQEKQQRLKQQQRVKQAASTAAAAVTSSNAEGTAMSVEPSTSVADWAAAAAGASSSESSTHSSSGSNGDGSDAAAAEAAKQQLGVLLEDMLRSPEGFKVVQRWLSSQDGSSSSSASNGSSSSSTDPRQAVEQLLADPEVKARLLAELQEQLCAISEAQMQRQKQRDSWRQ
jgi:hypothetical protein